MSQEEDYKQMSIEDFLGDSYCGRTCQVQPQAELPKEKTSASSSKKHSKSSRPMFQFLDLRSGQTQDASWVTDSLWLGEYMTLNTSVCRKEDGDYVCYATTKDMKHLGFCLTLNFSEHPRTDVPSRLTDLLEENPDESFNLSPAACQGILNRARRRGKQLPPALEAALVRQSQLRETDTETPIMETDMQREMSPSLSTQSNSTELPTQSKSEGTESVNPPVVIEMTSTKNTIVEDGVMPTLTARMGTGGNQVNAVCIGNGQMSEICMSPVVRTLDCMHDPQAILSVKGMSMQEIGGYKESDVASALKQRDYKDATDLVVTEKQEAQSDMFVVQSVARRLTPTECERLQDFPDGWTDLGDWVDSKGKKRKAALSPRYRALGNSIALPFWRWLMRRISACYDRTATLGSLFDGIGGFPLCWTMANGPGSVLWASEIEEFPIAVTTKHFGDEDKGIEGDLWQVLAEQERKRR